MFVQTSKEDLDWKKWYLFYKAEFWRRHQEVSDIKDPKCWLKDFEILFMDAVNISYGLCASSNFSRLLPIDKTRWRFQILSLPPTFHSCPGIKSFRNARICD